MGFFESFLELNQLKAEKQPGWDPELTKHDFRKFILDEMGPGLNCLKTVAPGVLPVLQKPQQLLYDDPDYYIAIDTYTYTYYICYRQLLMIDVDFQKLDNDQTNEAEILAKVEEYCQQHPELCFRVYRSRNGLHLFLISQPMDHRSDQTLELMFDLDCDFYYAVFCYWRGWSIRLNRKKDDPNDQDIYQYLGQIGQAPVDIQLDKLVNLHINLMKVFQVEDPNLMW